MNKLKKNKLNPFQVIGSFFYDRKIFTILLWIILVGFGIVSYTTTMKREGFPSINIPLGIVQVQTFSDSAKNVDESYALPLLEILKSDNTVKNVSSTSTQTGATLVVTFKSSSDVQAALDRLIEASRSKLPLDTNINATKLNPGKFTPEGDDLLISVHSKGATPDQLDNYADDLAGSIGNSSGLVESAHAINLIQTSKAGNNGLEKKEQVTFDRFLSRENNEIQPSAVVAVKGVNNADQLKLFDQVSADIDRFKFANEEVEANITSNFAESIREQIGSLQKNLFEGLLVVLAVSFVLISLRISLVTALAMSTTIIITVGILNLIGYSLNTITLFSLVLCLALIVDDTTIIAEAMDAGLKDKKSSIREVAVSSLGKVGRASTTGTLVTMFAFAPMLFISGILGEFIRAIPVTIITSLAVSITVSLIFIPLMIRLSFFGKNRRAYKKRKISIVETLEKAIAGRLSKTVIWSDSGTRERVVMSRAFAVLIGTSFLIAGGFIFSKVGFNIFPAPKDGNQIAVRAQVVDLENSSIEKTEALSDKTLEVIKVSKGSLIEKINLSSASSTDFIADIRLTDYAKRSVTSVALSKELNKELEVKVPELAVSVAASGVGPPASAFVIQLRGDDEAQVRKLAKDLKEFLDGVNLKRSNGTNARIKDVSVSPSIIQRRSIDGDFVEVSAHFEDPDTSTLVLLAQSAIKKEFNSDRLQSYELSESAISFDLGQEQDNQDSFSSMGKAAIPLFIVMFLVMAFLFRSLLQPLLIFTALPFAFFGVALGLFVTDSVISFFSMLGVFALIGISLNNTILLTDYANEAQKDGMSPAEAMAEALRARLRPLLTTSITSVLALLPLALHDPFWEGLSFTLIFGLISSTVLVLIVFPYYYLIAESFRNITKEYFQEFLNKKRASRTSLKAD